MNMDSYRKIVSNYFECQNLLEVESKRDPETEPYRSKYKAKALLLESVDLITKVLETSDTTDLEAKMRAAKTEILGKIGVICLDTNDIPKAEEYLMECLASITDRVHPNFIIASIHARNLLGFIWSQRSQFVEAKKWLEEAEQLYKDFRNNHSQTTATEFFSNIFGSKNEDKEKELEKMHTLTKFYLAQVYGALKDLLKSTIYCHETLKRELINDEYEPIEWALDSATLSQVLMERLLFTQARHHLAAASYILKTYEETVKDMQGSQEEIDSKKEELFHRSSDVSRCWAKYGIFLLQYSKARLSDSQEKLSEEKHQDLQKLYFDNLDLSLYENQITDSEVVTFKEAREVFLITQMHLNKAKEYYALEERASDHVQIVQDHSQLFRHLTAFEPDKERQFKMMKKRVKMLESVLNELNPTYYLDVCRQLWFELGETYHDMMQNKLQGVKDSTEVPMPRVLSIINTLAERSIANFNNFLDSLRDKKTKELHDPLLEELIGPTLIAHFYLGRLYYKYITQDKRKQIENTSRAYECFKFLVDNCEKNDKARSKVGEELNISKQMMTLLQMKINSM